MCHVLGRDVAITLPLISRLVPHFGEDPEDFAATLFEVAPTVLFTVPRYLQKFASHVLVGVLNSSRIKRGAYEFAMRFARRHARRRWDGTASGLHEAAYRALQALVFRPILNKLGFDRLELVISGGASLPAETAALWQIYGVNVVEMYGQTEEAGGIIAGQRGPFARPGNVGTAVDGWRSRSPTTAKCWCAARICSTATGKTMTRRARSSAPTAGCAPAMSANGVTALCALSIARATSS